MAISHVCASCGHDLARERCAPDPHYGLPIVICPRCGIAAVRNLRVRVARRIGRRLVCSLTILALHLGVTGFMGLVIGLLCVGMGLAAITPMDAAREIADLVRGTGATSDLHSIVACGLFAGFSVLAGLWLGVAFEHLSVAGAIVRWGVLLQCAAIVLPVLVNADQLGNVDRPAATMWDQFGDGLGGRVAAAGMSALIAVGGVPLGSRMRSGGERSRARLLRRARTRRNRARLA